MSSMTGNGVGNGFSNGSGVSNGDAGRPMTIKQAGSVNSPFGNPLQFSIPNSRPTRESVLKRLYEALMRRSLTKIDLSQRGLRSTDAKLVKMALLQNAQLSSLKLGYNHLGDEGVVILSRGLVAHKQLVSLDLGFNHVGDTGLQALANALLLGSSLSTLYLSGNLFSQEGALALSDAIRSPVCHLQQLHLTGNRIGPDGVSAITNAIVEKDELAELFLGGTNMGSIGCSAVAQLLQSSSSLTVISLANCDIGDYDVQLLAASIKENRDRLPLEALQLSFNNITCKGLDSLTNALWGSQTLREILLDNNNIGERGGHQLANILPHVKTLQVLDLGFNSIPSSAMRTLMKVVAHAHHMISLSVSGNHIDTAGAKLVAYALAYNRSLKSLFLDHCMIEHEGQRHIVAGVVSNRETSLRKLTGFRIGPITLTIGFPIALEQWTNEQVLNFIHLMWEQNNQNSMQELDLDPLNFLPDSNHQPVEASTVVEVAKRAFASLCDNGERVFMRPHAEEHALESPVTEDAIIIETESNGATQQQVQAEDKDESMQPSSVYTNDFSAEGWLSKGDATKSFVAAPSEVAKSTIPDPARKKRIVDWLYQNIARLHDMVNLSFDAGELWQLHQHYFTPVVKESGGTVDESEPRMLVNSVPNVGRPNDPTTISPLAASSEDVSSNVRQSDPAIAVTPTGTLMLKRKVSYRFLGDAALSVPYNPSPVTKMIQDNQLHVMPAKRARRNKTRISFLPRIQERLDSHLDASHEKALVLMRQLYFVEGALLRGAIFDEVSPDKHLCGLLASEAEMILIDMM